jgi:hypothetical protein
MTSQIPAIIAEPYAASTGRATHITFTWQLALFFLFNVGVVNGLIWWLSPGGFQDIALQQSWDVLRGVGGDDSWGPMAAALGYLSEPGEKPLYSTIFFDQGIKFQYPPSALFALEGMMLFGEDRVRTYDEMVFSGLPPVNDIAGWIFLLVTAISAAALLEAGLRKSSSSYAFGSTALIRAVLVFGFTLTFYPAAKAFTLGQIQLWINSIFALAMILFVIGGKWSSGVLMGAICLMKPHYGLFALWGALNREWRFAAACTIAGLSGLAFSIWHYGWANHLDYLRVLSFISERGESFHANQSINGLLNRLASLSASDAYANTQFDAYSFPPYNALVYWGTMLSSIVILLAAFLRRGTIESRVLSFSILAVSLTIASPIAWEHHYGVLLPIFAFIAGILAASSRKLIILAISYVLVSNYVASVNLLGQKAFNFLQSYTLAGGLVFLLLMHVHLSSTQRVRQAPR